VGRAWPEDIADDGRGRPVVTYSLTVGHRSESRGVDSLAYARWNGHSWIWHWVAKAGTRGGMPGYRNGGITLDHRDPRWLMLARTIGSWYEVEMRHTTDGGASWASYQLTSDSGMFNIRPVFARGLADSGRYAIVYVQGTASSYRSFQTRAVMQIGRFPG
jgi:hypothetical protein